MNAKRRRWTMERNNDLLRLFYSGASMKEMSSELGTGQRGIEMELRKIAQRYGAAAGERASDTPPPEFDIGEYRAGIEWVGEDLLMVRFSFSGHVREGKLTHAKPRPRGYRNFADDPAYIARYLARTEEEVSRFLSIFGKKRKTLNLIEDPRWRRFREISNAFFSNPLSSVNLRLKPVMARMEMGNPSFERLD